MKRKNHSGIDILIQRGSGDFALMSGQTLICKLLIPKDSVSDFLLPSPGTAESPDRDDTRVLLRLKVGSTLMSTLACPTFDSKIAESAMFVFDGVLPQRLCTLM